MHEKNLVKRNLSGMRNSTARFAEVEHAEHVGLTLKRIVTYFLREKAMVQGMLGMFVFGMLCRVYAPSLQSRVIDIIAGGINGALSRTLVLMIAVYLLYQHHASLLLAAGAPELRNGDFDGTGHEHPVSKCLQILSEALAADGPAQRHRGGDDFGLQDGGGL